MGIGVAAVAGVTALDFTMAKAMSERDERRSRSWVDYSDRMALIPPSKKCAARRGAIFKCHATWRPRSLSKKNSLCNNRRLL